MARSHDAQGLGLRGDALQDEPILKSRRRPGVDTTVVAVRDVRFGDGSYPVLAGPLTFGSEASLFEAAAGIAQAGGSALRVGKLAKPQYMSLVDQARVLETAGLETGLPVVARVAETDVLAVVAAHVDVIDMVAAAPANETLLVEAAASGRPVLLCRSGGVSVEAFLDNAEVLLEHGNDRVILCDGGASDRRAPEIRDVSVIPRLQQLSHLPVVVDGTLHPGNSDATAVSVALSGRSVGADGLVVPVDLGGSTEQLSLQDFVKLMQSLGIPSLRDEIDRIDRELIRLLARRLERSLAIGRIKAERGLTLHSPEREQELLDEARSDAISQGIDPDYIETLLRLVLDQSRQAQTEALET